MRYIENYLWSILFSHFSEFFLQNLTKNVSENGMLKLLLWVQPDLKQIYLFFICFVFMVCVCVCVCLRVYRAAL